MPIGRQKSAERVVEPEELLTTYNDLIKPALLLADPTLEVIRADEVAEQGTVTTDILTRLMYNDLVIVDISYPNPNVFYELGVRHACRPGTIIIRDKAMDGVAPFDVHHERHIIYEKKLNGEKALADRFRERLVAYEANPALPDNHLLAHAKNSKFNFPQYGEEAVLRRQDGIAEVVRALVESEGLMDALVTLMETHGKAPPIIKPVFAALRKDPQATVRIFMGLIKAGLIDPATLMR